MSAPPIRIRVGAAVDKNVADAFKPIVDAARAARQAIEDEMARAWAAVRGEGQTVGKGGQGPYRSVVREAEKASREIVETERRKQRQLEREQEREKRRREAAARNVARIRDRYFREEQRREEREERQTQKDGAGRIRGIGGGTVETLGKIGRGALGVAGSIARGAGVQTDLGTYVGQAVELEKRASELSASAYQQGGQRRNVRTTDGGRQGLVELARQVGNQEAYDPTAVIEGLQAFVGKTGALDVGEASLGGLAKLARATGTELADMVSAAGDASNALGEVGKGKAFETAEEKAAALVATMRTIAGQGKVGAVEIADLSREMAKLGAASMAFGGDKKGNIEFMGALAQMARASGGAAGPAEAATAVQGFVNTLKTPARIKAFVGAGVKKEDIYDEAGALRDPKTIIANALKAAGDDPLAFKKLFANVVGAKTVEPAANTYRDARAKALKGGMSEKDAANAGVEAVMEMFAKFNTAISAEEEQGSRDRNMKTAAARVQLFNNKLSEIGEKIADKVLPQLERLAPTIISVADAFAKMVGFAAENPGYAITAAITASIGKAAIGTVISAAVTKMIEGASGKMSGKAAMALGMATISIAAATIIAQTLNEKKNAGAEDAKKDISNANAAVTEAEKEFKATGTISPEKMQAIENARIAIVEAEKGAKAYQAKGGDQRYFGDGSLTGQIAGGARQAFDVATGKTSFEEIGRGAQQQDQLRDLSMLRQSIDAMKAAVEAQGKGTQKVEITNLPAAAGPIANTTNTTK